MMLAATTKPIGRLPPSPRKMRAGDGEVVRQEAEARPGQTERQDGERHVALDQRERPDRR